MTAFKRRHADVFFEKLRFDEIVDRFLFHFDIDIRSTIRNGIVNGIDVFGSKYFVIAHDIDSLFIAPCKRIGFGDFIERRLVVADDVAQRIAFCCHVVDHYPRRSERGDDEDDEYNDDDISIHFAPLDDKTRKKGDAYLSCIAPMGQEQFVAITSRITSAYC